METKIQNIVQKPPVVVVMGHIDHGKTSLLLAIRKQNVPIGKPGGEITQHVGAYQVERGGKKITFIDTPGHEAFSQMRKRGAKVADIAVLVVAGDEGVKPQTKEAIEHIKKAEIPFIVAINKIDKPSTDAEKVKRELAKEDVLVESMGGKVPVIEVSAKEGKGIEDLLELILLVAEMEDLKTDVSAPAQGVVIESYLDSSKGPLATLILNQGKLEVGQIIGTYSTLGKIKKLEDFQGNPLKEALPADPVVLLGFENVPQVGEEFKTFATLEEARNNLKIAERKKVEEVATESEQKVLNLILKTDVLGSLEAIEEILRGISQKEVTLKLLKADVGEITEADVKLAMQTKAIILGFRVKINPVARSILKREKAKVLRFDIVYDLLEEVRKLIAQLQEPEIIRTDLGKMKVLVVFLTEKNRQIVGGKIIEGQIKKGASLTILRNGEIVGKGKIINLQKNKKDIEQATKGEEVGILYEGEAKIEVGDILEIYTAEKKKK